MSYFENLMRDLALYLQEHYTGEEKLVDRGPRRVMCQMSSSMGKESRSFSIKPGVERKECASAPPPVCAESIELDEDAKVAEEVFSKSVSKSGLYYKERLSRASFKKANTLEELLHRKNLTFYEKLQEMLQEKGLDEVEIYNAALLDRRTFSKLRKKDYKPAKRTVLALIIGMELNMEEAKELLMYAGYAFMPSDGLDQIVSFFIERGNYDIFDVNETLFRYRKPMLGSGVREE